MEKELKHLSCLLLSRYNAFDAGMVVDHINAFSNYSRLKIFPLNVLLGFPAEGELDLTRFDIIVVHYSISIALDSYIPPIPPIPPIWRKALSDFPGLKVVFIQDEYRFVNKTVNAINELGFSLVFTCVPEIDIEKVYPKHVIPGVRKVNVLTGYVSPTLLNLPIVALDKRRYDVGYRGRCYPLWHGQLGIDKWKIARDFQNATASYKLKSNISVLERKRLYGVRWVSFIRSCKTMLGVESGASYFDFDEVLSRGSEAYSELLLGQLPRKFSERDFYRFFDTLYKDLEKLYFEVLDNENGPNLNQISPRCFEAAALRTGMILYEGHYSGVLKPWRHYIPLKKDCSNIDEVVRLLKDSKELARMISLTYSEVANNPAYSYKNFIKSFDDCVIACLDSSKKLADASYSEDEFFSRFPFFSVDPVFSGFTGFAQLIRRHIPPAALPLVKKIFRWIQS